MITMLRPLKKLLVNSNFASYNRGIYLNAGSNTAHKKILCFILEGNLYSKGGSWSHNSKEI